MRQGARREPESKPPDDIVAEDERRQHLMPGTARPLADREHRRQDLHRRLAGDKAQPFAQLDRTAGDPVEQSGGARIVMGPAAGIDRGPAAGVRGEPLAQLAYLGPLRAGQDDAESVEQHEPRMTPHRLGYFLAPRLRDKSRQFFDLLRHAPGLAPYCNARCASPRARRVQSANSGMISRAQVGSAENEPPTSIRLSLALSPISVQALVKGIYDILLSSSSYTRGIVINFDGRKGRRTK